MLITAQRVTNLTAAVGIVSWQAFWMTRLNRSITDALPTVALTELGIGLLDKLVEDQNFTSAKHAWVSSDQDCTTRRLSRPH